MNEFFAGILNGINTVIGNYGWSMVIFTLLFKLIIMPLNYKSRKSMRRMSNLQPQMTKLQKKYENDKEKLNQKMSELYRKEGVNPMSGCLPMILSMAILIIMFNAMRMVANNELASQCLELLTTGVQTNESWLWVKNIWMPDSPFHPIIADSSSLRMIPADVWAKIFAAQSADAISKLAALGIDANTISGDTVFAALQALPTYAQGQPDTGKFMKYFFPFFTLFICSGYNAAFALYWVVSNIYGWVESIVFNKVLEKQDAASAAAVKEDSVK